MAQQEPEEKASDPGTGEAPLDRLPGEPPDEASDDSEVAICPDGQQIERKLPTEIAAHGPMKVIEEGYRLGILR